MHLSALRGDNRCVAADVFYKRRRDDSSSRACAAAAAAPQRLSPGEDVEKHLEVADEREERVLERGRLVVLFGVLRRMRVWVVSGRCAHARKLKHTRTHHYNHVPRRKSVPSRRTRRRSRRRSPRARRGASPARRRAARERRRCRARAARACRSRGAGLLLWGCSKGGSVGGGADSCASTPPTTTLPFARCCAIARSPRSVGTLPPKPTISLW